jgi:hypothetical protein
MNIERRIAERLTEKINATLKRIAPGVLFGGYAIDELEEMIKEELAAEKKGGRDEG